MKRIHILTLMFFAPALLCVALAARAADPLPSWNEGAAKSALLEFIARTTREGSADYVPAEDRVSVFDNDGTLWVEQPIYTQVMFAIDRVKELAPKHPEWKGQQPFETILSGNLEALSEFTIQDFEKVIAVSHTGITVQEFDAIVTRWLATARHPRFNRLYTELAYQPMLEVLHYFRASGYKTFIVTGGGQDFVRNFAPRVYGVPPEQTIGSAGKTKYQYNAQGKPELIKLPEVLLIDDKTGKPEGINLLIGRRPYAAFGNSTGDQQMLEWTAAGNKARLMMLVHHDDAAREYAYGAKSKVGTFSDALEQEAQQRHWIVISMKRDWRVIFSFEK